MADLYLPHHPGRRRIEQRFGAGGPGLWENRINPLRCICRLMLKFRETMFGYIYITMVNFQYFFDRLLLFAVSRLELNEEFEYYLNKINSLKMKTQKTFSNNDWLKILTPFSSSNSVKFKRYFEYRRDDLLNEIRNWWIIDNSLDL